MGLKHSVPHRWDLYWADVVFSDDITKSKRRPILIVDNRLGYILAYKATSTVRPGELEYQLIDWRKAGLDHETVVRINNTVDASNLPLTYIGTLTKTDIDNIKAICKKYNISLIKESNKMKLINRNKLNEAISKIGNDGTNNMDDGLITADTAVHGEAPHTYVDAIQDHIKRRAQVDEATKEIIDLADEVVDENQVEAHTKPKATPEMKKLKLAESLFEDYAPEQKITEAKDAEYSELDEIDPFDLVMDTLAYTGRQVMAKTKEGKITPRAYNGLYGAEEVKPDADSNIVITVKTEEELEPALRFAEEYEIEILGKKYDKYGKEWNLKLDPYTVNLEKLYADKDRFITGNEYKVEEKEEVLTEDIDFLAKLDEFHPWGEAVQVWETIKKLNKVEDLEKVLEGYYTRNPDKKPSFEQLNDLLTFESNWIYDMLEIAPEDIVVEEDEFEYDDEVDYEI